MYIWDSLKIIQTRKENKYPDHVPESATAPVVRCTMCMVKFLFTMMSKKCQIRLKYIKLSLMVNNKVFQIGKMNQARLNRA